MSNELDIQKIAEELIAKLQKQSRVHTSWAEKAKYMAEGARELHDAIRREAERLCASGEAEPSQHPGITSEDDGC